MEYELNRAAIPQHIAIIMDGNGRWAQQRGLSRSAGHAAGVDAVRRITEECVRLGVKYLTLYTFSTENWNRPQEEVAALMQLLLDRMDLSLFMDNNVRFRMIGGLERLSQPVQDCITLFEKETAGNTRMTAVVAMNYSSRWELTETMREAVKLAAKGELSADDISEDYVSSHLQTRFMPDPDLLIRTGGELRISNYLLWQCAYSEFYFCETYWPDFTPADLHKAIAVYQKRQRRFGLTEEQVEKNGGHLTK